MMIRKNKATTSTNDCNAKKNICTICQENVVDDDGAIVPVLFHRQCANGYHEHCLNRWLATTNDTKTEYLELSASARLPRHILDEIRHSDAQANAVKTKCPNCMREFIDKAVKGDPAFVDLWNQLGDMAVDGTMFKVPHK